MLVDELLVRVLADVDELDELLVRLGRLVVVVLVADVVDELLARPERLVLLVRVVADVDVLFCTGRVLETRLVAFARVVDGVRTVSNC